MTTTHPSPKERVAARLQMRFPADEVQIDGPWVRVVRDGEPVLSVLPRKRRFAIPGVQWPERGFVEGSMWPEDLADAAADALEAIEAERRGITSAASAVRGRALDRLTKLLALAADQRGLPEGETAARLALRVMADAGLVEGNANSVQIEQRHVIGCPRWERDLWGCCCEHVGAVILEDAYNGGHLLVGTGDQLDLCEYLQFTIARGLVAERVDDGSRGADEFLRTAVAIVERRLRAMRVRGRRGDPAADAAARKRAAQAAAWTAVHITLDPPQRAPRLDQIALWPVVAGAEAGRRVPIVTALKGGV